MMVYVDSGKICIIFLIGSLFYTLHLIAPAPHRCNNQVQEDIGEISAPNCIMYCKHSGPKLNSQRHSSLRSNVPALPHRSCSPPSIARHKTCVVPSPGWGMCGRLSTVRPSEASHVAKATTALFSTNSWPLWSALFGCAAGANLLSNFKPTSFVSSPLVAMGLAFALTSFGIIPSASPVYELVLQWVVPLAATLYVLESDFHRLLKSSKPTLIAFLIGAVGSVLGTLFGWYAIGSKLGREGAKVACMLCASYVGGSINMVATAKSLSLESNTLLTSAIAADNVAMGVYLAILAAVPVKKQEIEEEQESVQDNVEENGNNMGYGKHLPVGLFGAVTACAVGLSLAKAMEVPQLGLAFAALIASGVGTIVGMLSGVFKFALAGSDGKLFAGCERLGDSLMLLFFATIGAACGSVKEAIKATPYIFILITLQLSIHLLITVVFSNRLGIPRRVYLTASNANIGGPGTAAGMATSRGWSDMVQPAILTGSLGYAIGTAVGIGLSKLIM